MPIDGGFVGMVDRDVFDEWLRQRAAAFGAIRRTGTFRTFDARCRRHRPGGLSIQRVTGRTHAGARPRRDRRRRRVVRGGAPVDAGCAKSDALRVRLSRDHPLAAQDQPAASTPHVATSITRANSRPISTAGYFRTATPTSVGIGSAQKGFSLRKAVGALRDAADLDGSRPSAAKARRFRCIPLSRWDNGRDVVLAGDAAGVVAPASGEGIYYAMAGGPTRGRSDRRISATSGNPARACSWRASAS